MRKSAVNPYVEISCRIDEKLHCRCYRESQLLGVMEYLRSHNVDVVYVNGEQTTVSAWLTTHYDAKHDWETSTRNREG